MKKSVAIFLLTIMVMLLTVGCSEKREELTYSSDTTGIIFLADGGVKEVVVESFAETYYDADELKTMVENAISDRDEISVVSAEKVEDSVCLQVKFATCDAFLNYESEYISALNYEDLAIYNGLLEGLSVENSNGYVDLEGATYDISKLKKPEKYNVAYINQAGMYQVEGYIAYISSNITLLDSNSVQIPEGEEGFIIYENANNKK